MKGLLKWFGAHKIVTAILVIVIIIVAATTSNNPNTKDTSSNSDQSSQDTTSSAPATQPSTPAPAAKAATRQVAGKAATLGAGTFVGGTDVAVGLYDVTAGSGQSGNFSVSGKDEYNEILGSDTSLSEVSKVRTKISQGDKIDISGLSSVTFTPVSTPFNNNHATTDLYAGTFTVGEDLGAGKYVVTPGSGQSGNFSVSGKDYYNEILGSDTSLSEVPSVNVTLQNGDVVAISGLTQVTFTAQ